jgi:hypothetical protein
MCDFISWVEKDGCKLFLTDKEVFSAHGAEVFRDCRHNDLLGHGAIRSYFAPPEEDFLKGGRDHEARDFWNIKKLPPEVQALHPEDPESFLRHWGRMWYATPRIFQPNDLGYLLLNAPESWNAAMREQAPRVIDCNTSPFVPNGDWTIEEHRETGTLIWSPDQVQLYLSDTQRRRGFIHGHKLRKELEHKPVLNANVLDHLLANPHLIPLAWRSKFISFWGTIFRLGHSSGRLCVRHLFWHIEEWCWGWHWFGDGWNLRMPSILQLT